MSYEKVPYTIREKMNIATGLLGGIITPIIAGKYAIDILNPNENFNWAFSITANCVTVLDYKLPIPVYTGIAGIMIGKFEAERLKRNRLKQKNNLEDMFENLK